MTGTLSIDHLLGVCEWMGECNQTLFEIVGGWVTSTDDPVAQQLFAVACHRHAWHAELWAGRVPSIPIAPKLQDQVLPVEPEGVTDSARRVDWYAKSVERLLDQLGQLDGQIDAVLDPGTARVIALVRADLVELQQRAWR